jgi:hypothetical protein
MIGLPLSVRTADRDARTEKHPRAIGAHVLGEVAVQPQQKKKNTKPSDLNGTGDQCMTALPRQSSVKGTSTTAVTIHTNYTSGISFCFQ